MNISERMLLLDVSSNTYKFYRYRIELFNILILPYDYLFLEDIRNINFFNGIKTYHVRLVLEHGEMGFCIYYKKLISNSNILMRINYNNIGNEIFYYYDSHGHHGKHDRYIDSISLHLRDPNIFTFNQLLRIAVKSLALTVPFTDKNINDINSWYKHMEVEI